MDGLTSAEHAARLAHYGLNRLEEHRRNSLLKLLTWFASPIALMLAAAALLSLAVGRKSDAAFIAILAVLNIAISFWHEHKADKALEELRSKLSVRVRVKRDGMWRDDDAVNLVPGDLVELTVGDLIPADGSVLDAAAAEVNESVVTGESLPKEKRRSDALYSGSVVAAGLVHAEIEKTGNATYFGTIMSSSTPAPRRSGLERDILSISRYLMVASLIAVILLTVVLRIEHATFVDIMLLDLSLLIAGLPVSLPTVMTLIISTGALILARRQVLVRRLAALEDLANVDLLLTDKTGTLTESRIVVEKVVAYAPWDEPTVLGLAAAGSSPNPHNLLDHAVTTAARAHNAPPVALVSAIPADSTRKRTTALVTYNGQEYLVSSGMPPIIEEMLARKVPSFDDDVRTAAANGSRVIAVAVRANASMRDERVMELAGIIVLSDPLRTDAKETVCFLMDEGVEVKMVTGDALATAVRIAEDIGLAPRVMSCRAQSAIRLTKSDFSATSTFAEVLPEDKLALVALAHQSNRVAAVTGDGVNDLPALRNADVGIAVENAVDALKAVADIVLLSHGIGVIRTALVEARNIFARLSSYATYRISESFRLVVTVLVLGFVYKSFPLTPVQLLLLALLNDIPIISLAFNRVHRSSKPSNLHSTKRFVMGTLFGLVGVANSLILFFIMRHWLDLSWPMIQAAFFLKLAVSGHMLIYVVHTKEHWWRFLPSRAVILATSITQLAATALVFFGLAVPALPLLLIIFVWIWSFLWMQVSEVTKYLSMRIYE